MSFQIEGKIALITGGASGIGFHCAQALLRNGIKGVTLADINPIKGDEAIKNIENEFGTGKVIFVNTDVTNKDQLVEAFEKTIRVFGNIDILLNNAGVLGETMWEKMIAINLNGVISGMLLGVNKFLSSHHQGPGAVIINLASVAGLDPSYIFPVYSTTKSAVIGITRAMAGVYEKSQVRVVAVCPGLTDTNMAVDIFSKRQPGEFYAPDNTNCYMQEPSHLSNEIIRIVKYASNKTIWVVAEGKPAFEYKYPSIESMEGNLLNPQ